MRFISKRPSTSFDSSYGNEKRRKLPDKQDSSEQTETQKSLMAAYYQLKNLDDDNSEWKRDFKKRLKENHKIIQSNRA